MNINPEQLPTYKSLLLVQRNQATSVGSRELSDVLKCQNELKIGEPLFFAENINEKVERESGFEPESASLESQGSDR